MTFRLIDKNWGKELETALSSDSKSLRIICPFIKDGALTSLLSQHTVKKIQVITRYNLVDFFQGVSDTKALRALLKKRAHIRGIKNLHAKVFLFGKSRVIVTSANLTAAALNRNHEFGFISTDTEIIEKSHEYFEHLWERGGDNLDISRIDLWDKKISACLASGNSRPSMPGLRDEGADAGIEPSPSEITPWTDTSRQVFVKFLGEGSNRAPISLDTVEVIDSSACHWALGYPTSQRPTGVEEGALMFIARLTNDPQDIRIFGRAIAMRHVPGRDDATPDDIKDLNWKAKWSRYIRVHDAEFLRGTLKNGISLYKMMEELGANSFLTTQRNANARSGNTDPRKAYSQKPAVQITSDAFAWLNGRLERAFARYGTISKVELDRTGWPEWPLPDALDRGPDEVELVGNLLEKYAQKGVRAVFYEPIMQSIGLTHRNPHDRRKIGSILGEVSERSFKKSRVLLSVLVHQKGAGETLPGKGFFELAKQLNYTWSDDARLVAQETSKVLKAYQ
jgi:hypothetical protein